MALCATGVPARIPIERDRGSYATTTTERDRESYPTTKSPGLSLLAGERERGWGIPSGPLPPLGGSPVEGDFPSILD